MSTNEPPPYPGDDSANNPSPPPPGGDLPTYGSVPPPAGYQPPPGYQPPAPAYGGDAYEATAAFGWAWRAFKANAGQMVLATVLVAAVAIVLSLISEEIAPSPEFVDANGGFAFDGGALLLSFIAQTITGGLGLLATALMIRGALDVTEGRAFSISEAAGRIPVLLVVVTGIVISLLTAIGFVLLIIPGVLFAIFSFFAIYSVVDRGDSTFTAIGSSFSMVGSNFGQALLSGLLAALVLLAGAIALLVGLLVAVPITVLAGTYAYKRFSGQPVVEIA